eukprot:TRINITY_DN13364_c0_g2_i1.p1 TRINITY_DN13364_c0_g2~~TRINITY_DN13364_c0_g2_i1.p1  ORF type:complete len:803 (-),score=148.34 TRINITY_DN13364_c0_g2_i1:249-2657(-)
MCVCMQVLVPKQACPSSLNLVQQQRKYLYRESNFKVNKCQYKGVRQVERQVECRAISIGQQEQVQDEWWKTGSELWEEVFDEAEFRDAINTGDKLVLVDFYATWCKGCKRIFQDLNRVASNPDMQSKVKFVKFNVDRSKVLAKGEGVKAMPFVQIYRPGEGVVFGFHAAPHKVKALPKNVKVALDNPDKKIILDPNGFAILKPRVIEKENRQEVIEQLSSQGNSLFERLSKMDLKQTSPTSSDSNGVGQSDQVKAFPTPSDATSSIQFNKSFATNVATPEIQQSQPVDHEVMIAKQIFLRKNGEDYGYGGRIDGLYATEVAPRMKPHEHYLDYTGSSVYCNSYLESALKELSGQMFGNPHSANPSSTLTQEKVEEVREMVARFFNADPTKYQVAFTRSATGALKLVGETFPWSAQSKFRYLRENHNSVLGIREYTLKHGGTFESVAEEWVQQWTSSGQKEDHATNDEVVYNLFAYPAEDNFAGVKYPLDWIEKIQQKSTGKSKQMVLLDAAAYVGTQPLDLEKAPADFVAISFYKMFGFPTGLGALILKTDVIDLLRKVFWGGGTVSLATSKDNFHVFKCRPSDKLEDGTVAFLDIINLKHGFQMIERLGGIMKIQAHVRSLTSYLYNRLNQLRHSNGNKIVSIFGKHGLPNSGKVQGGIINFEVVNPQKQIISYKTFESEAAEEGFHIRTGIECNPGACYKYIGIEEVEIEQLAGVKEGCDDEVEFMEVQREESQSVVNSDMIFQSIDQTKLQLGHIGEVALKWYKVPLGSVRVSLGYMSTFEDCETFARFVETNYKDRVA